MFFLNNLELQKRKVCKNDIGLRGEEGIDLPLAGLTLAR